MCCGIVPLPRSLFNYSPHQKKVREVLEFDEDTVIPITEDGLCVFLKDSKCTVYDDRPEVCRKFGDESHSLMTCAFQSKDGVLRSRQERRLLERQIGKIVEERLK